MKKANYRPPFAPEDFEEAISSLRNGKIPDSMDDLNYKERAKIATVLSETLQKRRSAKDSVELLTPFAEWCASVDTTKPGNGGYYALNALRETLGRCRQKEAWIEKRTYKFKALKEPDIPNKEGKL